MRTQAQSPTAKVRNTRTNRIALVPESKKLASDTSGPFEELMFAANGNPQPEQLIQLADKYGLPSHDILALFLPEQYK